MALQAKSRTLSPNLEGALWMLASALVFTANGVLVKALAETGMSFFQIALARAGFALLAILPFVYLAGWRALRTAYPGTHVIRAVCGAGAMLSGFYALSHLPLADVTAIGFTTPLFATILAILFLGETVRWRRWTATLVGFGGVLIMLRPGALLSGEGIALDGFLAALGMAAGIAVAVIMVKRLPKSEHQAVMLLWFCLASIALAVVPAIQAWQNPSLEQWLMLAGVGVIGVSGQSLIIRAYRAGEASFVAPFDYSKILFAMAFGFLFFAEIPEIWTLAGAAVIVASSLYIAQREVKLGTRKERERAGVGE
ncbi:DMT family transporter [Algihabitans albus]|uniref:DMT family transporter n=1 Tax=Algihabitans albus TaxID=2164067 RepID=UPI0035CF7716